MTKLELKALTEIRKTLETIDVYDIPSGILKKLSEEEAKTLTYSKLQDYASEDIRKINISIREAVAWLGVILEDENE